MAQGDEKEANISFFICWKMIMSQRPHLFILVVFELGFLPPTSLLSPSVTISVIASFVLFAFLALLGRACDVRKGPVVDEAVLTAKKKKKTSPEVYSTTQEYHMIARPGGGGWEEVSASSPCRTKGTPTNVYYCCNHRHAHS